MRQLITALAVGLAATGGAGKARAQDEVPLDQAQVQGCFQQNARAGGIPDCVGDAAAACQAAHSQPETTLAISQCLMAETAIWDEILNREYKATRQHFGDRPALEDLLRDAQRGWIALRDADCSLAYDRFGGGSMRVIAAADCQLKHTALRSLQLHQMRLP